MEKFNFLTMFRDQIENMFDNNNALFGGMIGLVVSIPTWINESSLGKQHLVLICLLIAVLIFDYLAGSRLAEQSSVKRKNSTVLFDSIIRNFMIIAVCVMGYGVDYLLGTHTIIFSVLTFAFILQNVYSLAGNVALLGWDKHYPVWLFKWAKDEIEEKREKYFPVENESTKE